MSGKAADEISTILSKSVLTVESIVKESQSGIEKIMIESKKKIDDGIIISGKCDTALDSIVEDIKKVALMADEISTATREQEQGVSQIAEAMNQLQEATHKNSEIADNTLNCSKQLNEESTFLNGIVESLEREVKGGAHKEKSTSRSKTNSQTKVKHKKALVKNEDSKTEKVVQDSEQKLKGETAAIVASKEKAVDDSGIPQNDDPRFEDI
jgi:methyl-accepting chemotaxis protein